MRHYDADYASRRQPPLPLAAATFTTYAAADAAFTLRHLMTGHIYH
jgi:hypothetical protein